MPVLIGCEELGEAAFVLARRARTRQVPCQDLGGRSEPLTYRVMTGPCSLWNSASIEDAPDGSSPSGRALSSCQGGFASARKPQERPPGAGSRKISPRACFPRGSAPSDQLRRAYFRSSWLSQQSGTSSALATSMTRAPIQFRRFSHSRPRRCPGCAERRRGHPRRTS